MVNYKIGSTELTALPASGSKKQGGAAAEFNHEYSPQKFAFG